MREIILNYLELNPYTTCDRLLEIFGITLKQFAEIFERLNLVQQNNLKLLYFGEVLIYSEENGSSIKNQYYFDISNPNDVVCYRTDDSENFYMQLFDHTNANRIFGEVDYSVTYNDLSFNLKNPLLLFIKNLN
tara:strand:+ start:41389 stop:41787 length:399 start_codon:yes stop_codon:yes gene_type:complete